MALRREEIARKLLHLFALVMPVCIYYFPKWNIPWYVASIALAVVFAGSVIVETLRFRVPFIQKMFFAFFGSMLREEETHKVTGSTWVIGAALICSVIFKDYAHISFMVLTLFILGDAIAAVVGLSIGRIKIMGKKSLEGSLACLLLCMILFYALFPFVPGLLDVWNGNVPFIFAFVTSLTITVFELIPLRINKKYTINDNLAVPVIAGVVLLWLSRVVVF